MSLLGVCAALSLAGCLGTEKPYVDDADSPRLAATVIEPPDNAGQVVRALAAPAVAGTTAVETVPTQISDYFEYQHNADLRLAIGKLNHSKGAAVQVLSFRLGADSGIEMLPIERSTGQFSMETATVSANKQVDAGVNLVAAVNADPYNTFNGWNLGIVKLDGKTFTGWAPQAEAAIVVRQDGSADIIDKLPAFTLRWSHNGQSLGLVREVAYFDRENGRNTALRQAGGSLWVYPGDNFRGGVDLRGKTAYLVKPEVNGVTVLANPDQQPIVQFAPFRAQVLGAVTDVAAYIVPSGHALLLPESGGAWWAGDTVELSYDTDDASWSSVRHALGAGFSTALLVKDGQLAEGASNEQAISSRTAFGLRADGSAFFIVADKPVGSPSDGITLKKLGQLALAHGAVKAVNLDGGGSSTLAMRMPGERRLHLINSPSDGVERAVANKWGLALKTGKARYSAGVDVLPRRITLLAGSEYRFKALGFKGEDYAELYGTVRFGMSSAGLGLISSSGLFQAAQTEQQGFIVAQLGKVKGAAQVRVTASPELMRFELPEATLNAGGEVAVLPTLLKDGQPVTYSPGMLRYELSTSEFGSLDPKTGVFKAAKVQGKQLTVTVRYGELSASQQIRIGVPPVVVESFESGLANFAAGGARQKLVELASVSQDAFAGKASLRLSWQADPAQPGTFGAYLVDPKRATTLAGYPKALGVNVFIPEALAGKNWWVRGQLRDADNKAVAIDYNGADDLLPRAGWTFMKAAIPPGFRPPFRFDQPFRFLVLKTNERIDSFVYLDDFTAIYSDDTDLQGPLVTVQPANRSTLTERNLVVKLQASNASGLDLDRVEVRLDKADISAQVRHNGKDEFTVPLQDLSDGWHQLSYRLFDMNGNVAAGDHLFNVVTGAARVFVQDPYAHVFPAGSFDFPIKAVKATAGDRLQLVLQYDATKSSLEMVAADARFENVVARPGHWEGTLTGDAGDATLALMRLKVSDYVASGAVSVVIGGSLNGKPFLEPVLRKEIGGRYKLLSSYAQQGQPTLLQVVDAQGQPVAGVIVEQLEYSAATGQVSKQQSLGTTNAQGQISYTAAATPGSRELYFRVFGKPGEAGASLLSPLVSLPERLGGTPRYLRLTPAAEADAMTISWMTGTAVSGSWLRFGETRELGQPLEVSDTELLPYFYGAEAGLVRVHHRKLAGLKPGTTYYYQVGSAAGSSEIHSFRTDDRDEELRIHLFGDTQTLTNGSIKDGAPMVGELLAKMQAQLPQPDLILHVGDMTEDGSDYQMQRQFFEALEGQGRLASTLFVPTQGNHEVYNEGRNKFESLFRTPANGPLAAPNRQSVYAFDHGPMRIAVINTELFTDAEWQAVMDWLEKDMAASKKTWKVLMLHRPPYEGNAGSGNEFSRRFVPPVVDRAGIDLVIAGHDHQYARSHPLLGGVPNAKGATYLIAGSASAKFYNATSRNGMPAVAAALYDEDLQTYTTLHVKGGRLHLLTRNIYGRVVDQTQLAPRSAQP
ncbi:MAG: phosphodiester glycosidase family protein [Roseateles sp.]